MYILFDYVFMYLLPVAPHTDVLRLGTKKPQGEGFENITVWLKIPVLVGKTQLEMS